LIVRARNDKTFPATGAEPYTRNLKTLEYYLLDTGQFALEEGGDSIASLMRESSGRQIAKE